jgi:hypothetical protein
MIDRAATTRHIAREIYLNKIVERGSQPFDDAWMQDTFEAYWQYAGPVTEFTNAMLGEMPPHVQRILGTAAVNKAVALRFSHGYANPEDFQHWLMDPAKAEAYLAPRWPPIRIPPRPDRPIWTYGARLVTAPLSMTSRDPRLLPASCRIPTSDVRRYSHLFE